MSVTPFLRNQAFDPETIEAMSDAFTQAREILGLKERDDAVRKLVARRTLELAQHVGTKTGLFQMTVEEFTANPR